MPDMNNNNMNKERGESITPPPSPSPPRSLLASPVPSSPSPRAVGDGSGQDSPRSTSRMGPQRPVAHSHFQMAWKQNQTTGLMTLVPTLGTTSSALKSSTINPLSDESDNEEDKDGEAKANSKPRAHSWRNKERMKTTGVAIALCLNLGTDPPDSEKVAPCARTECGIDPTRYTFDSNPYPALKLISTQLEEQFRNLQPRARIKLAADPTVDMIRKTCTGLRKAAKNERVLVHFNGHGVPRPTRNGEIWAFNDDFTQYIPLSIFDLIRWTGHPAMFTFDCSSAGQLIPHFLDHEKDNERKYRQQLEEWRKNRAKRKKEQERRDRRERDNERLVRMARVQNGVLLASTLAAASNTSEHNAEGEGHGQNVASVDEEQRPSRKTFIVLVPCGAEEALPSSPQLPADLFTCCLTVPIQTALRWFILQNRMTMEPLGIEQGMVNLIPGKTAERKTMLGELNWIFTAVTDTIAWSVLPRRLFQKLFRQDLLVASMLRHFLLAERIFRTLGCTPQSIPMLPPTWKHRMWDAWDQAVEMCLTQLPSLIPARVLSENGFHRAARIAAERQGLLRIPPSPGTAEASENGYPFNQHQQQTQASDFAGQENHVESRFFKDQLQAFEMWLSLPSPVNGIGRHSGSATASPEQLPVVLQVLLSHQHRFVALDQLARFLDLGPWAVSHALSVGIFPYVLKLLQSPLPALKSFLVRIWVRILDLDPTCRDDLNQAKEQGYFVRQLSNIEDTEHAARAALVLCISCEGDVESKAKCLSPGLELDRACAAHLQRDESPAVSGSSPIHSTSFTASSNANNRTRGTNQNIGSSESDDGDSDSEGSDERSRPLFPQVQQVFATAASSSPNNTINNKVSTGLRTPQRRLRGRDVNLVRWSCLVLAKLWDGYELGRTRALNNKINKDLERLLSEDDNPEVREAAVYALGMLLGPLYTDPIPAPSPSPPAPGGQPSSAPAMGSVGGRSSSPPASQGVREEKPKTAEMCDLECDLAVKLLKMGRQDGSPLVRREILYAVSRFVTDSAHVGSVQLTVHILSEFRQRSSQTQQDLIDRLHSTFGRRGPKYMAVWLDLTRVFAVDPFPAVSQVAQILMRFVKGGVEARIEAIRGRAGEGGGGPPHHPHSSATPPSSSIQDPLASPLTLLESDLFSRSKRQMCRCRQEMEDDAFFIQVKEATLAKRLKEDARAKASWSRECLNWAGQSRTAWDYYHDDEATNEDDDIWGDDEDVNYANPRNLKAPFLQLLKTQQQEAEVQLGYMVGAGSLPGSSQALSMNINNTGGGGGIAIVGANARQRQIGGSGMGGVAATGGSVSTGTSFGASSQHSGSDHGTGDLVRRFDQLPLDLFSSSNATRPLRRSSSFQSQLFRQSSQSLASLSGGGTRPLTRSATGNSAVSGTGEKLHKLEEVHRVDFGKPGSASSSFPVSSALFPYVSTFHPISAHVLIATQQAVSCYDFTNVRIHSTKFSNLNIAASSITSLAWIDAKTDPLLLTCSDDGHIRVWRDPVTPQASLITAFSPFGVAPTVATTTTTAPISPDRRSGLGSPLIEWVPQVSQALCTSAFSSSLRVWDLLTERLVSELIFASPRAAAIAPPITSLASSDHSCLFAAGFADGTTRIFDRRTDDRFVSVLVNASSQQDPVVAASKISRGHCMATVTTSGEVRLWDIRMGDSAVSSRSQFRAESGDAIYAFHPNAPFLACATRKTSLHSSAVKVLSFEDIELCQVKLKPSTTGSSAFGFMGSTKQVRDVSSLAWHPKEIALCVGNADFASIHVAPNTRVRGVWSPPQMLEPLVTQQQHSATIGVGLTSNSHHSNSNTSI